MVSANIDITPLNLLRATFPWPNQCPSVAKVNWSLDTDNQPAVERITRSKHQLTVLEFGSFLGSSAKKWLEFSPHVTVICVDSWASEFSQRRPVQLLRQSHPSRGQLEHPDGIYQTFLANLWDHRDRVIPIRGPFPETLIWIDEHWVQPDVITLDGDKSAAEIRLCHELFPQVQIFGAACAPPTSPRPLTHYQRQPRFA